MIMVIDFSNQLATQIQREAGSLVSLKDMELVVTQLSRKLIRHWLEHCEEKEPAATTRCRNCGHHAIFVAKRTGYVRTKYGVIRFRRAYYECPDCHQSTCPLDERLNPIESLARLRVKIAAGKALPVAEISKAWGLGSLESSNPVSLDADYDLQRALSQAGLA
ncbi:MAG: hypothetical protein JSV42_15440 [Chloroflexota bacterium]|nr:MAG: hypothetical protein JSV42_15440 [Chloroflexota bacterium]